jgi:hypothetical protein
MAMRGQPIRRLLRGIDEQPRFRDKEAIRLKQPARKTVYNHVAPI